eukprot:CAMPEP_0119039960 /NCGR_PEP_ID=MMETSP1177-20130426/9741_1 /TAXON_ID=2985 /ORGANISM="Ochromonas sp, Strain CCMP1899" /LENGTH=264 /DNA_ID=CAMNT_0007004527 /DNA_START=85 /DNA_END=879 /DNA_ORIENTATION=-
MKIQSFVIYISYEPIGSLCYLAKSDESKHWVLIFKSEDICLKLDANNGIDDYVESHYEECDFSRYENKDMFVIAHFSGYICDIVMAVNEHTMNGTIYCVEYNNCQHYVARVLVYLESNAKAAAGRSLLFNIDVFNKDKCRYLKTMEVLARCSITDGCKNEFLNKRNIKIAKAVNKSRLIGSIGVMSMVASGVSVPATGILGSLGCTTSVLGSIGAPVAFAVGIVGLTLIGASVLLTPKMVSTLSQSKTHMESKESSSGSTEQVI